MPWVEDLLRSERGREDLGRSRRRKRKMMGKEEEKVLSKQHGFDLLTLADSSI